MKEIIIYTDGSSRGNPGPGGYGTVLIYQGHKKELNQGYKKTTNNRMEIMAAIAGLESLKEPCKVTIYSDSKYVVDSMDKGWLFGWKKKGWSRGPKKPLKNADLWKRMDLATQGHDISWKWVKGHAGIPENERCDELANEAAESPNKPVDEGFKEES